MKDILSEVWSGTVIKKDVKSDIDACEIAEWCVKP